MSKDGINVNEAPDDFYRPAIPPAAPPSANCATVKPVPCRCGREADWLLDGSIFGCNSCFISGTSFAEWNALVAVAPRVDERIQLKAENEHSRKDWQAECLKKGFEYVRESDDHYVLADVPEMAALLADLLGVEVRDKENHSYGETVSSLNEQIDSANNAFHRAYEAEKEVEALRKALIDVRDAVQREYWDEYAGLDETRAILVAAIGKEVRP